MAGRLHVVLGQGDRAVLCDDDGGADDAGDSAPVVLLLAPRAPRLEDTVGGVGGEGEDQGLGLGEALEGADRIGGHADDGVSGARQALQGVAEVAGLLRASGRGRLRVEVDDDAFAAAFQRISQRQAALRRFERESGGALPRFEPGHAPSVGIPAPARSGGRAAGRPAYPVVADACAPVQAAYPVVSARL